MIKKIIRYAIQNLGYAERIAFLSMSTKRALERIAARDVLINSVFDVGASNGSWSLEAKEYWPNAHYHLIEANAQHVPALEKVCASMPKFSYVLAAASDEPGNIYFDGTDAFSGLAMKSNDQSKQGIQQVLAITLDGEVKEKGLIGPYMVKLDTHGFELPILNGAKDVLKEANLVIIEAYNFQLESDSLKFWEICHFMHNIGFDVIDISEPMWRPKDNAFWQMDLHFIPKDRSEFLYNRYA